MLHNQGQQPFQFHQGDNPVAQIILIKIITPVVTEVSSLPPTNQTGGFGSTNQPLVSCISLRELEHTLQPEDEVYLCEITESGIVSTNAQDPHIQPLLAKYQDVFPEELPTELLSWNDRPKSRDQVR